MPQDNAQSALVSAALAGLLDLVALNSFAESYLGAHQGLPGNTKALWQSEGNQRSY